MVTDAGEPFLPSPAMQSTRGRGIVYLGAVFVDAGRGPCLTAGPAEGGPGGIDTDLLAGS